MRQLLELGRTMVSDLDLDSVLRKIVDAAVDLTGARYGALGVLDQDRTELERFITVGIDDERRREIGDLPRGRGVLGVLIRDPQPLRLDDVGAHHESYGFPMGHPPMKTFLGTPVRFPDGEVYGNLYLTEKQGADAFSADDEDLLILLAEWAGVAVANARRFGGVSGRRNELERAVHAFETTTEIAQALAGETELDRILELIVKRSRAVTHARTTVLALADGDELAVEAVAGELIHELRGLRFKRAGSAAGDVLTSGRGCVLEDVPGGSFAPIAEATGASQLVIVPLRFRGRALGVLIALDRIGDPSRFDSNDERLLSAFASAAAPAVATAQHVADAQLRRSIEASERERTRWARELHDETLQDLAAVKTVLAAARRVGDAERLEAAVDTAIEHLQTGITGLRSLITDLRPASLDQLGIEAALGTLAQRVTTISDLDVRLEVDLAHEPGRAAPRHEPELEAAVYRIVQEALTNVVKHAQAATAVVALCEHGDQLDVTIADDGRGVDDSGRGEGFGVTGMHERAALAGGSLVIAPGRDTGTLVRATFPVRRRPAADQPAEAAPAAMRIAPSSASGEASAGT